MPTKTIQPIIYKDAWHKRLADLFTAIILQAIFNPLVDVINSAERMDNAKIKTTAIEKAIRSGLIVFDEKVGAFKGKITAEISKELKELGGKFKRGFWRLPSAALPSGVQKAIYQSRRIMEKIEKDINRILSESPEVLRDMVVNLDIESLGVDLEQRVSREFKTTMNKALSTMPDIGKEGEKALKTEYVETEYLPIRKRMKSRQPIFAFDGSTKKSFENFAYEEIVKLREELSEKILQGRSRPNLRKFIRERLQISADRARFIARQETALFTAKIKEGMYKDAGVDQYKWVTNKDHIVRDTPNGGHKALDGKIFSWDNPPSSEFFSCGEPCNPGEDYNCRCVAQPIVEW